MVLEISGGNDGLNTLVPYADDAYYRQRPKIGIKAGKLRKLDDHFGFNPGMVGFERLYKDGKLAVVHGCGYDDPSFSHFTSMAYWHTAAPNSGEEYGWVGRLADAMDAGNRPTSWSTSTRRQSLAVRSRKHVPVVFDDPDNFVRKGFYEEKPRPGDDGATAAWTPTHRAGICSTLRAAHGRVGPGARGVGPLQDAGGLRHHRPRPDEGRGADRRRHAHAALLQRLTATTRSTPTCIRTTCTSAC